MPTPAPAPAPRELRAFALTVGAAFLAIAGAQQWRGNAGAATALAAPGVVLILLGLAAPRTLGPVHAAWMAMAHAMSRVTTPLFLAAVYFLVLTPIGVVVTLAGRSSIRRRRGAETYWAGRPPGARRSDLRRQF